MYDIIGDIHGHATALERLLTKLGYKEQADGWQHPDRKVIFLGDFVDRGPEQLKTITIAKTMVDNHHALAVMGNHEFNAIAWATLDQAQPGQFLRTHTEKNFSQHAAFLNEIGEGSTAHQAAIAWFKQLPLYLDLPRLRVVHACWHQAQIAILAPYLNEQAMVLDSAWPELCREGSIAFEALETILKGMEIALPDGVEYADKDGHIRQRTRTSWWLSGNDLTYRDLAMVPSDIISQIPHEPVPQHLQVGYDVTKPLFIGHYWMNGTPSLINKHIACLDWSIAADNIPNAKLCAYQWRGESELTADHMVWVAR